MFFPLRFPAYAYAGKWPCGNSAGAVGEFLFRNLPPSRKGCQQPLFHGGDSAQNIQSLPGRVGTALKSGGFILFQQADEALLRHIGRFHLQHTEALKPFQKGFPLPPQGINAHPLHF